MDSSICDDNDGDKNDDGDKNNDDGDENNDDENNDDGDENNNDDDNDDDNEITHQPNLCDKSSHSKQRRGHNATSGEAHQTNHHPPSLTSYPLVGRGDVSCIL